jgi:hypothetical protein
MLYCNEFSMGGVLVAFFDWDGDGKDCWLDDMVEISIIEEMERQKQAAQEANKRAEKAEKEARAALEELRRLKAGEPPVKEPPKPPVSVVLPEVKEVPKVSPERQAEIDASLHRTLLIFALVTLGLGLLVLFLLCDFADNDWHNFSGGEFIILWLMVSFLVAIVEVLIGAAVSNAKS